jgi:hypothetical protein
VLKVALALASRRGHAQVTPLHIAFALLAPSCSLQQQQQPAEEAHAGVSRTTRRLGARQWGFLSLPLAAVVAGSLVGRKEPKRGDGSRGWAWEVARWGARGRVQAASLAPLPSRFVVQQQKLPTAPGRGAEQHVSKNI